MSWETSNDGRRAAPGRREGPGRSGGLRATSVRFTGFSRSSMRYKSLREPQADLSARIKALADERPRWGYRQIHTLLRREGWRVNRKRVQRLYREAESGCPTPEQEASECSTAADP